MIRPPKWSWCILLITLSVILCDPSCSCDKETDLCKGKVCIECGSKATHYASGPKPTYSKVNSRNSEEITSTVYRLFYCDDCWSQISKKQLSHHGSTAFFPSFTFFPNVQPNSTRTRREPFL